MKKLMLGLLGLCAGACQPATPPRNETTVAAPAKSQVAEPQLGTRPLADSINTLSASDLSLLRQHNLAPLWANQTELTKQHPAMEGFYGPAYYRISFYFKDITRDTRHSNVFHVAGLDRYKKVITPFTGTITVQSVQPFTKGMFADADSTARAFTAAGRFVFAENPATKGAGTYYGKALLDFTIDAQGHLDQAYELVGSSNNPTKGCGMLFSGYQLSNQTGQRHSVAFANFYGAVVPQALKKLGLGDRSEEVNPNLAKLGWNEAWENDEWWADSPKPSLNL